MSIEVGAGKITENYSSRTNSKWGHTQASSWRGLGPSRPNKRWGGMECRGNGWRNSKVSTSGLNIDSLRKLSPLEQGIFLGEPAGVLVPSGTPRDTRWEQSQTYSWFRIQKWMALTWSWAVRNPRVFSPAGRTVGSQGSQEAQQQKTNNNKGSGKS